MSDENAPGTPRDWPCHCGGERPDWGFHAENACGVNSYYASWAADGGLGERFPHLGGES